MLTRQKARIGPLELDPSWGELSKLDHKLSLSGEPVEVLAFLRERPGQVITRKEFCQRRGPKSTFFDFEHSLNLQSGESARRWPTMPTQRVFFWRGRCLDGRQNLHQLSP